MQKPTLARPCRRAVFAGTGAVLSVCVGLPSVSGAQLRAAWDVNATVAQFETGRASNSLTYGPTATLASRWLDQQGMGGALRYDNPFVQLNADAQLRAGEVSTRATGGLSVLLATPSWKGFRVSATIEQRHAPNDLAAAPGDSALLALWAAPTRTPSWRSANSASVAYAREATGLWLRATNRRGAAASDSLSSFYLATGLVQQIGNMAFGLSVGAQRVLSPGRAPTYRADTTWMTIDSAGVSRRVPGPIQTYGDSSDAFWSRWTQTAASFAWGRGRFAFDAMLGARPRSGQYRAAVWGEAAGTAAVTARLALIASLRTAPPLPGIFNPAHRVATLGLRVAPPAFWRLTTPTPIRASSRRFSVRESAPGQYVFTIDVPNARTVELAGDFTVWKSVSLRQINSSRWEILLPVSPGPHRCNVRVDGAEWVPPPGLASVSDEFNGRVGLFIAE